MPIVITLAALAALVWALNPPRPKLTPAPLEPQSSDCAKLRRQFIPTNITSLPEAGTDTVSQWVKNRALLRLNMEPCSCGCTQSVAACRVNDPACETSAKLAREIVSAERGDRLLPAGPPR